MTSAPPSQPAPAVSPDRLYAVEADLDRMARHLVLLRDQLAALRTAGAGPVPASAPVNAPVGGQVVAEPLESVPVRVARLPWWQREGAVARLLSVVGAGVFLIGISLLLLLAVQYGHFGPVLRVTTGWLVSAVLVGVGALVHARQPGNPGSVALAATGIAGGYLALLAMTAIYGWLGVPAGLALAGAVCALGLCLTRLWRSQVLGVIVVLGVVVLAPVVAEEQPWIAAAFLILVSLGALAADPYRVWPVLHLARVVPAALALCVLSVIADPDPDELAVAVLAAGFAGVTIAAELLGERRAARGVLTAIAVGAATLPALVAPHSGSDATLTSIWLGCTAAVLLALAAASPAEPAASPAEPGLGASTRGVLLAAAALALVISLGGVEVDRLWVLGALATAAAYLGFGVVLGQRVLGRIGIGAAVIGLVGYLPIVELLLSGEVRAYVPSGIDLLTSAVGVAVVLLAARFTRPARSRAAHLLLAGVLWAAGLLAVTGLAVTAGVLIGTALRGTATGFLAGHAAATVIWMAAAAWLLMRRQRGDRLRTRTLGIVIAGLAVAKLVLFDLSTLDGVSRVVAFVVTGAVLLAVGTLYRRSRTSVPV